MSNCYLHRYDWPFSTLDSYFHSTLFSSLFDYAPHAIIKSEDDKSYTLVFDVPGFKQDEVNVEVDNSYLTVSAKNKTRSYSQSVYLGHEIDAAAPEAELKDGVLTVTLARRVLPEPRKVPIKSSV